MTTFKNPPSQPSPLNDAVPKPVADRDTPRLGVPTFLKLHNPALAHPEGPWEVAIVGIYNGWRAYAQAHRARYRSTVGEDGALGPQWEAIGHALLALLSGSTGRLDCGTLDATIRGLLIANGCTEEK